MVQDNKIFIKVNSPDVIYTDEEIISNYKYKTTNVERDNDGNLIATPKITEYVFKTKTKLPKFGLMMVGWGGNNGSTGILKMFFALKSFT